MERRWRFASMAIGQRQVVKPSFLLNTEKKLAGLLWIVKQGCLRGLRC